MKTFFRLVTFTILACFLLIGYVGWQAHKLFVPASNNKGETVVFEVLPGTSGATVAHQLQQAGVILDEFSFRLMLRFEEARAKHSESSKLRAGVFRLDPSETPYMAYQRLLHDPPLTRQATFPEGRTTEQVAKILVSSHALDDSKDFLSEARFHGKDYGAWLPTNVEGYLFPETYKFPYRNTAKIAIEEMTGQFHDTILPIWESKKSTAPVKSLHDVVILASLVEREAQVDSERGTIAGVYVNRIKKDMKLECDATVQFALGKNDPNLKLADLKVDSPYNTYLHTGLPPGPIANPGRKSLVAAMSPTPSEYLYYVRNDKKDDGSHVFAKTYAEHLENCRKYQK